MTSTVPFVIETDEFIIELIFKTKKPENLVKLMKAVPSGRKRLARFAQRVWKLTPEQTKGCGCSGS